MLEMSEYESSQTKKRVRRSRIVERKWDDEDTWKLIQLVEEMRHLWDPAHEHYKDNRKRESSFEEIGISFNRSASDSKAKWDNLRVQYRFHFLKDKYRRENGDQNYAVKWKYYPALYFLNSTCKPPKDDFLTKNSADHDGLENSWNSNTISFTSQQEKHAKIEPCDDELEQNEMLFVPSPILNSKSDSSQIFGDFVADRLRHLAHHNAEFVKNKILKIILDASKGQKHNDEQSS